MALWDFSQNRPFWGYGFQPLKSRSRNPVFWLYCWENRTLPSVFRAGFRAPGAPFRRDLRPKMWDFLQKSAFQGYDREDFRKNQFSGSSFFMLILSPERTSQTDYKAGKERKKALLSGILGRFCGIFGKNRVFGGTVVSPRKNRVGKPFFRLFPLRNGSFPAILYVGAQESGRTVLWDFEAKMWDFRQKTGFWGYGNRVLRKKRRSYYERYPAAAPHRFP